MDRSRANTALGRLHSAWGVAAEASARTAAGSAAALLRVAEAATLASAAGVRSVLDLTRTAPTSPAQTPEATPTAPAPSESEGPVVPQWDELNLARIRGRLPRLSLEELRSLLAYEHDHARRAPILSMLEKRIAKVESRSPE